MPVLASECRRTSLNPLQCASNKRNVLSIQNRAWQGKQRLVAQRLLKSINQLSEEVRSVGYSDFERIFNLASSPGQDAIRTIAGSQQIVPDLESRHDRALWLFLHDLTGFRRAEDVLYAELNRQGPRWSRFIGSKGLSIGDNHYHRIAFEEGIKKLFHVSNAFLELYERDSMRKKGQQNRLIQAVIYREDTSDKHVERKQSKRTVRAHRPVLDAVITYEAKTGVMEVVAPNRKTHQPMVRLFAKMILQQAESTVCFRPDRALIPAQVVPFNSGLSDGCSLRSRKGYIQ
ncbi:MAG: hypothetical protein HQL54_03775 [Magnetococcales bacterium]|nr:hypothetical protein [Magnetococcales bacterium]